MTASSTKTRKWLVPTITVAVLLVVWELVVRLGLVPNFLLPSPTQTLVALVEDFPELVRHAGTT